MKSKGVMVAVLLIWASVMSGCVTIGMWDEKGGPGVYEEGDVKSQTVEAIYVLRSREGATFFVPGHPDQESIFTVTLPHYTQDIDRFIEVFSSSDGLFRVRSVKMAVGLYEGRGYWVDVDFTSKLPVDRVVELFAGSGITTEEEYRRVSRNSGLNFKIHYGAMVDMLSGEGDDDVSYYTYSMVQQVTLVKSGVLPMSDEYLLLPQARYVPLGNDYGNYSYVVYEHRYKSKIPLMVKVVSTPITVAVDAAIVGVGVPAALVIYVLFIAPSG
ncbi:MAG: hypothetical protein OEM02_09245 [Desulfobulbaceae bacterium]|nr:hypothetical protein [Desulfobulbaceae bacterium]